jgi:hypothetical protein
MHMVHMPHKPDRTIEGTLRAFVNKLIVNVPMPEAFVSRIDRWRYANKMPSRSEAIRVLIERGLSLGKLDVPSKPPNNKTPKKPAD